MVICVVGGAAVGKGEGCETDPSSPEPEDTCGGEVEGVVVGAPVVAGDAAPDVEGEELVVLGGPPGIAFCEGAA